MKRPVVAFLAGLVFAVGLALAGMTEPGKVLGFLDVAGRWDPSLAFVMGGALLVCGATFAAVLRRARPAFDARFHLPAQTQVDRRLVVGSALFGVGWGISGFCPGPAIVSLAAGARPAWVFVLAMGAGMALFEVLERLVARRSEQSATA